MSVQPWEMSWFLSQEAFVAFLALLWLLLVLLLFRLMLILANPQEGRLKNHQCRDNRRDVRAFVLPETSWPSRTHCDVHPDMDPIYEIADQFNRTVENLTRFLDKLSCETPDGSESSWTTITGSEVDSSSRVSLSPSGEDTHISIMTSTASSSAEVPLSPSREDPHSCIMTNEANSSTELRLSPLSEESWTSTAASNPDSFSLASALTPVDEAEAAHASGVNPGLGHPRTNLEEQPGPDTFPFCEEDLASCLEGSGVQQQQQDLRILTGAPTSPPEVPEVHTREMEMPLTCHKDLDTLESLIPKSKHEQELGLPASVDETPQTVPASAAAKRRRPEKQDVMVVPIVQDLHFLKEDMKSRLEHHIYKMKIQRRYGLQKRILECEESFEKFILR